MMGVFSLSRNGQTVTVSDSRMKEVWTLIAYLILNRENPFLQEKLVEVLWNEKECENPANALKNLVYRSRNLLRTLITEKEEEPIVFFDGTYIWNPEIPCSVDCEEMEYYYRQASAPGAEGEKRLHLLEMALSQCRGEFLSRLAFNSWAAQKNRHFLSVCEKSVLLSADTLRRLGREKEVVRLAQWAVNLQPMNRSFQALLIRACLDSGNCAKALEYYNDAADLFFRKTGTGVPEEIRTIYQQMLQRVHTSDFDLSMIQEELREADTLLGAFFCDYEVFKNIYRLHARTLLREGRFLYIALVSIVSRDGRQSSGKAAAGCHGGNEGNTDYWPAEGRCGFCVQSQPVCADDAVGRRRDRRPGVEQVEGNLFSELSRFRS
ncbi:MAG: AfsR/SARP family transcriptional regulator [Candidatus Merdivicinus sp.]